MKVLVCNDCSPEFVELQFRSFEKYLQEPLEFIVFNCEREISKTPEKATLVADVCHSLGIQDVNIPRDKEIEDYWLSIAPGYRLFGSDGRFERGVGGDTFNYMLQWVWQRYLPNEKGTVCFCHSDVFLIEPIRLSDYAQDYSLCAVLQHKLSHQQLTRSGKPVYAANPSEFDAASEHEPLTYPWEAFMLVKPEELPGMETMKWWPMMVEGTWTDTGGPTHYYFKAHPEIKLFDIPQSGCHDDPATDFHPSRYSFFHLGDKRILHYYSGSRWCTNMQLYWGFNQQQSDDYHARKLEWAKRMVNL